MSCSRKSSLSLNNEHGVVPRRSPRRLRTKTPSINELSKKFKVSPKGKRRLQFKEKEPLKGKKFYLDLQNFRKTGSLISRIEDLGGEVEEFLSKDISFVITNKKDVDTQCSAQSPSTPSPGLSVPSPIPGTKSSSIKGPSPQSADSQNSTEPKHDTRGKALMKRATGIHKSGSCDVITNARTWGVHVIQLDKFLDRLARYVSKEKVGTKHVANDREIKASGKPKVRQLKAPFIKVEDLSRQYRPLVHELKEWPRMYFDSPVGTCPFDRPRQGAHASQVRQKSYKEKGREEKQKKRGYCECCCCHYKDLDLHLRSDHHQGFARDDSNYVNLDALIKRGPGVKDFVEKVRARRREQSQTRGNDGEEAVGIGARLTSQKIRNSDESSNEKPTQATPVKTPQGSDADSDESPPRITRSKGKPQRSDTTPLERSNEEPNKATPMNTPQGSDADSGESPTRITRSKGKRQRPDTTPLRTVEAKGRQEPSGPARVREDNPTDLRASHGDPQENVEKKEGDARGGKPEEDEEGPSVRVTRSAKNCAVSASPQKSVQGSRSRRSPLSEGMEKPRRGSKEGKESAKATDEGHGKSPGSKGGDCTAPDGISGDHDESKLENERSPVGAHGMARSDKRVSPGVRAASSEGDSSKENSNRSAARNREGIPEQGRGKQSSVSTDNELDNQLVRAVPTTDTDPQDPKSFTKVTRTKAKALSRSISEGPSKPAKNCSDDPCVKAADQRHNNSPSAVSDRKTRSSPRFAVTTTIVVAGETTGSEGNASDTTESLQLSQEPPAAIRTQTMQVRLTNTLSGTSSSTITVISSCDETARPRESEEEETDEGELRTYPLRNRSSLPGKEHTTKEKKPKHEPQTSGTKGRAAPVKKARMQRRDRTPESPSGVKLRKRVASGASASCVPRNETDGQVQSSPGSKEAPSCASSPQSDSSGHLRSPCSSSPRSGLTPARIGSSRESRSTAKRDILSDRSEGTASGDELRARKQRKGQKKRRVPIIFSEESDLDSIDDSLIAHNGTSPHRKCLPISPSNVERSSPGKLAPPVFAEPKGEGNKGSSVQDHDGLRKLSPRDACSIFETTDEEEEFHGFEIPHFDQSLSSERDLSFQIESIVENMTDKEDAALVPSISFMSQKRDDVRSRSGEVREERNLTAQRPKSSRQTKKCLDRDILSGEVATLEGNAFEDDEDESAAVAESEDEEEKPATGLAPRIELNFQRRKRVAATEHDDVEICTPAKRSRSHSETSEECLPTGKTERPKSEACMPELQQVAEKPLDEVTAQERCNDQRDGGVTTQSRFEMLRRRWRKTIDQDILCIEPNEQSMYEMVSMTLEERVKLRRSKGKNREEPRVVENNSQSNSKKGAISQKTVAKDTRRPEQEKKSRDGKDVLRNDRERREVREIERNGKGKKRPEQGRSVDRKMPKRKIEKSERIEPNRQQTSTAEVLLRRKRAAPAREDFLDKTGKRSVSIEDDDDDEEIEDGPARSLRPLQNRSGPSAKQAPKKSSRLKGSRPSKLSNSVSSNASPQGDRSQSSEFSCSNSSSSGWTPSGKHRSSANWIFNAETFTPPTAVNKKKPRGSSAPVADRLLTSRRKSSRFLIDGDKYAFIDENTDVYEFCG